MDRVLGFLRVSECPERLTEQRLEIRLTRVDDVEDPRRMTKWRCARLAAGRRGRPERATIGLLGKAAIVEVLAEESELPELVGDVLADVGDDAVGTDDDLLARRFIGRRVV